MPVKKIYSVIYIDYGSYDLLGEALVEGYDEDDAREAFSMQYELATEILDITEVSDTGTEEEIIEDTGNMFCDDTGYCSGVICPHYWSCSDRD